MPLKVSDGIGTWIKDFKKSKAPQFKGKDEKERRDMAIAAYLSAKNGDQKESVKTADRKPEMYTKPDGKRGVRMVPTDKEVVKKEAVSPAQQAAIAISKKERGEKPKNEKTYMRTDSKLKNLKVPVTRKKGKILNRKTGKFESVKEGTSFAVSIEGLPIMYMTADSPGMLKQTLRKIIKQPSMIQSVKRVTDADVKKTFRLKAQGREEE